MLLIPIRTESAIHRTPTVNYLLIATNVALFFIFNDATTAKVISDFKHQVLAFQSHAPAFHQFLTYQFLHAHPMHLIGNMLFLWVFGNSVNSKMGDLPYLMFYLAGGIFAAWGFALMQSGHSELVGASGAIAAITAAYLALFPRSHVTVLLWVFVFVHFFEWPAMILILLKIIVWDNVIGPSLVGSEGVAHTAHLAGYFFGFVGALLLLLVRGLPRDQFDILALWDRWHRRRAMADAMADSRSAQRRGFSPFGGAVQAPEAGDPALAGAVFDRIADLRSRIGELVEQGKPGEALTAYQELQAMDSRPCLAERHQLAIARYLYAAGLHAQSAAAFERFIEVYPRSQDTNEIRMLLGIIYARDLKQPDDADKHLTQALSDLKDEPRRAQCLDWLRTVRMSLDRPLTEAT